MISSLRSCIAQCKEAMSMVGHGTVSSDMEVGPNTRRFLAKLGELCSLLPEEEQRTKDGILNNLAILKSHTHIHPFAFGEAKAWLLSLDAKVSSFGGKRIFISHSSSDKVVVKLFVDKILQLGTGIDGGDVFCTSIEESGIANGQDMRRHIEKNILGCDLAILLLSKAYNKSSICLNEMGAVWCSGYSDVRIFTLPRMRIPTSIGWLMETRQAECLDSEPALDGLHAFLMQAYGLHDDLVAWGRHKREFLRSIAHFSRNSILNLF